MTERRRARRAKQARRDARRAKKRDDESSGDTTFRDALRRAVRGHPLDLLSVASMMINVAKPRSLMSEPDANYLDQILAGLMGNRSRETTALLAVIAELLVDDAEPQLLCRREVDERGEHLPRWIGALSRVEAYRAVRRSDVFGDVDEISIGLRLDSGHELTVGVGIDHNLLSSVLYGGAVDGPIDEVLARLAETSTETSVSDMTLADARAWIEDALSKPPLAPETESWPLYRPLFQWLVCRLPKGGERRSPAWLESYEESYEELCETFFATDAAAPFTDPDHRDLLLKLLESGSGDPLRWSAARVKRAIALMPYLPGEISLEVMLDAPDLLRAFIPFAHARSGIRDELTSRTLAAIDSLRSSYKRKVLSSRDYWWLDDAV